MATKRKDDIEFEVGIDGNITKNNEPKVNKKNNIEFEVDLDGNIHKNEYSKKTQLPKSATKENEKFSFSNTLKNIEDTINNSAVKNHGLNLSNVITDIANINDAKNEFKATLPVIGNAYKTEKKEACSYCPYHGVCGFDERMEGFSYRKLKRFDSDTDIIAEMRKEAAHGDDVDL